MLVVAAEKVALELKASSPDSFLEIVYKRIAAVMHRARFAVQSVCG